MTTHQQINEVIVCGMGCFWGAEKRLAACAGVRHTECGYAGGDYVATDGYEQVLTHEKALHYRQTSVRNHAEVVRVTFDPTVLSLFDLLKVFWENHNPTQGDRQGNDIGSNYRSALYFTHPDQCAVINESKALYQRALHQAGYGDITTEIAPLKNYMTAEEYHQRYLQKNPNGYCGLGGTGVRFLP